MGKEDIFHLEISSNAVIAFTDGAQTNHGPRRIPIKKNNNKTIPSFNHSVRTRSRMQKVCTKATRCNMSAKCSAL